MLSTRCFDKNNDEIIFISFDSFSQYDIYIYIYIYNVIEKDVKVGRKL